VILIVYLLKSWVYVSAVVILTWNENHRERGKRSHTTYTSIKGYVLEGYVVINIIILLYSVNKSVHAIVLLVFKFLEAIIHIVLV